MTNCNIIQQLYDGGWGDGSGVNNNDRNTNADLQNGLTALEISHMHNTPSRLPVAARAKLPS
jgi:hypothetical protein